MIKNIISNMVIVFIFTVMMMADVINLSIELDSTLDNGWLICIWAGIGLLLTFALRFFWCHVRRQGKNNRRRLDRFLNKPKRDFFPFFMTLMLTLIISNIIVKEVNEGFASDYAIEKPFTIVSFENKHTHYKGGGDDYHEIHVTDGFVEAIVFAKKDAVAADYLSGRVKVSVRRGGWGFNIYRLSKNWKVEHPY